MSSTANAQIIPVSKPKQPYPQYLGGIAASIAASITHPLDLTKVRLQASGDTGMIQSLRKTVRTAGKKQALAQSQLVLIRSGIGVRGLFDGVSATLFRQMTYSMCRFWAYDESKKFLGAGKNAPAWKLALAGSMAGGIAGVVGNPGEILMVRMQGDFAKPPEKRLNYKNCFDGLFRMIREEGWSSLSRGVYPNVIRSILMNASQLASYDYFKSLLLQTPYFKDNIYCHFTASLFAGTVATTVCSPADVLKSRVMNASGPGSSSAMAVLRNSFRNEGPMFMFKGWIPAWTRLQPTTILIFLTLEQLKNATDWDSGGFQMVSLSSFSEITEEGVRFSSPFTGEPTMLTPEESMSIQHSIGADIIMQLDDVAHKESGRSGQQNLFAIVQGGLSHDLRDKCLEGMISRKNDVAGYAIGGLSGGEEKDVFWKIISQCTAKLPTDRPRYSMGIGFAEDLMVCMALGVDMADCVFPTRTARFGVALTFEGPLNLRISKYANAMTPIEKDCPCPTCKEGVSRAILHHLISHETAAAHAITQHNLVFQARLMGRAREAVLKGTFPEFLKSFFGMYFGGSGYPRWCVDALRTVGVDLLEGKQDAVVQDGDGANWEYSADV
ncbi:hypothetical protein FRB90_001883 [Tulasnella sp. 427]|nr:hypothetical protein FRB90_001883 [Tulasnella sp. 427]